MWKYFYMNIYIFSYLFICIYTHAYIFIKTYKFKRFFYNNLILKKIRVFEILEYFRIFYLFLFI